MTQRCSVWGTVGRRRRVSIAYFGVSRPGDVVQPLKDRPRPKDSGLVLAAWEVPWPEGKTAEPSESMLRKERARRTNGL